MKTEGVDSIWTLFETDLQKKMMVYYNYRFPMKLHFLTCMRNEKLILQPQDQGSKFLDMPKIKSNNANSFFRQVILEAASSIDCPSNLKNNQQEQFNNSSCTLNDTLFSSATTILDHHNDSTG